MLNKLVHLYMIGTSEVTEITESSDPAVYARITEMRERHERPDTKVLVFNSDSIRARGPLPNTIYISSTLYKKWQDALELDKLPEAEKAALATQPHLITGKDKADTSAPSPETAASSSLQADALGVMPDSPEATMQASQPDEDNATPQRDSSPLSRVERILDHEFHHTRSSSTVWAALLGTYFLAIAAVNSVSKIIYNRLPEEIREKKWVRATYLWGSTLGSIGAGIYGMMALSRHEERGADAYAATSSGDPKALADSFRDMREEYKLLKASETEEKRGIFREALHQFSKGIDKIIRSVGGSHPKLDDRINAMDTMAAEQQAVVEASQQRHTITH